MKKHPKLASLPDSIGKLTGMRKGLGRDDVAKEATKERAADLTGVLAGGPTGGPAAGAAGGARVRRGSRR